MNRAHVLSLLDLTSLNADDDATHIASVCESAVQPFGQVAAVCVYPPFVAQVKALCPLNMGVATVVNFPSGDCDLEDIVRETRQALRDGACEIDMVFPYRAFLAGDVEMVETLCRRVVHLCQREQALVKMILETGALQPNEIRAVAQSALACGADFLKTSTGKIERGATPEAAAILLDVIRENGGRCGLKISGGVRTLAQAQTYIELAKSALGESYVQAKTFRIGASSLLNELLNQET